MKIAVNTRLLLKGEMDGIGRFTFESFRHIVKQHPEVQFVFIFDRTPDPSFCFAPNIQTEVIGPQARHPFLYKIWYQFSLKKLLKKIDPDIFVGTDGMIPLTCSTKTLSVIHDLNFEHHPKHLPASLRAFYCKYFPRFAKKATRIATVSEFSKNDIVKTYQISEDKIDVVYNGSGESFKPISLEKQQQVKDQYTNGSSFFLFVGTLHPRKNLVELFKAFDIFKTNSTSELKLLVVGKKMWWTKEIEDTYNSLNHKQDVIFAGRVNEKELCNIMASATALTYVPIFEGFGIPLVESMSSGVPVITSNVTSMPEVVENAGLLVDPRSCSAIAEAMTSVATDVQLRDNLVTQSLIQAKKFSWVRTGDLLWQSILKTIDA